MALPTKTIAWNRSLLNRCAYVSVNQAAGDVMYKVANELINVRAFTCKGSSTGAAAGMDGVFRWASGNDAKTRFNGAAGAQSWVAITLAGGRGDVILSYNAASDDIYNVWWSPGGIATVAGTATHEPTATDAILINKFFTSATPGSTIVGSTAAGDRLVSIWSRPDKGGFRVAVARAGLWESLFGVDAITPDTYGAGITVVPAVGFYINGAFNANVFGNHLVAVNQCAAATGNTAQKVFRCRRTNGGGLTLECSNKVKAIGWIGSNTQMNPVNDLSFAPELQGGATYAMKKYGLFSVTTLGRGDVGTIPDWYLSRITVAHGDTAGALEWICVEGTTSMWWDWDGATAVVMS